MLNARKYNSKKFVLIRTSPSIKAKIIELNALEQNSKNCSNCNQFGYLLLYLQDNGPYSECETIAEFCDQDCFNCWWNKEYIKPKSIKIKMLV